MCRFEFRLGSLELVCNTCVFFFERVTLLAGCREFAELVINIAFFGLELTDLSFNLVDVDRTEDKVTEVLASRERRSPPDSRPELC